DFAERNSARIALYQGPLALRFVIGAGGLMQTCEILADRVIHNDPHHVEWEPLRDDLLNRINELKFPPARGQTTGIKPVVCGPPFHGNPSRSCQPWAPGFEAVIQLHRFFSPRPRGSGAQSLLLA